MKDFLPKKAKCDSCEKTFPLAMLIHDGGFLLCGACKEYMDKKYEELIAQEELI